MGRMRILGPTGDTALDWDVDDAASVTEAAALFRQLAGVDSMVPFARFRDAASTDAELIDVFDADLDEILWVRPLQGG